MSKRFLTPLSLVLLIAISHPALAGPPGSGGSGGLLCTSTGQIRWVVDANGNGVREPAENSDCAQPTIDDSSGTPVVRNGAGGPLCVQAAVAQVRGLLTMITDDDARDNELATTPQNLGGAVTSLLEVRIGNEAFTIADSFVTASPKVLGDLLLGNWNNRITSEASLFSVGFSGLLFATPPDQNGETVVAGAFDAIGARLGGIAQQEGLIVDATTVVPIVAMASRDAARKRFDLASPTGCIDPFDATGTPGCGANEADHSGAGDSLASVARYRLTISFVEKLTGAAPTCN